MVELKAKGLSFLLTPLVLLSNLLLFRWGEVVLDVESLANFFRSLSLDHVCNGFAVHIQQSFNIQVVCCLQGSISNLKNHFGTIAWNNVKENLTRIKSKRTGCSTLRKSWSHWQMSSVRFSFDSSSSGRGGSSYKQQRSKVNVLK